MVSAHTHTHEETGFNLPQNDAYVLRRIMARMPIDDMPMSPTMRLITGGLNLKDDATYKMLNNILKTEPDIMHQVMMIDPTEPLPTPTHVIDADDLINLTAPEYILTDYPFYEGAFNALVGASGAGKSFVALDFAARMALKMELGAVVYLAAEGLHGYSGRWEAWKKHHKISSGFGKLQFYSESVNFLDMQQVSSFMEEISQYQPRMVIVDTVARCMVGGDENSARDMGLFVNHLDAMRKQLQCGALVVHHTGKDGNMRGSSALYGACDSVLFLKREDETIGLHNEHNRGGKNKFQSEHSSRYVALLPVDVTIKDKTAESAVVISTERIQADETPSLNSTQKQILETIQGFNNGLDAKEIHDATGLGKSTVYKNVKRLVKWEYLIDSEGKYTISDTGNEALNA